LSSTTRRPDLSSKGYEAVNPPWLLAAVDDGRERDRLSAWLQSWDADVWLLRPPKDALLYEPDATLYGVGLSGPMSIRLNHRVRSLEAADLIVVPPGLALDFEPEVDLLAICCAGQVPDHFRERFVQVWGYEHLPARRPEPVASSRLIPVIESSNLRYRLSYAVAELKGPDEPVEGLADNLDLSLVVHLEGSPVIELPGDGVEVSLCPGQLLGLEPGLAFRLQGSGRAAVFRLVSGAAFHARRAIQGPTGLSPEAPGGVRPA